MKVLFISSSNNTNNKPSNIVLAQGESLKLLGVEIDYFGIKGKGILGYLKNIRLIKNHLNKNKYDVIHAHFALCGVVAYLAKKRERLVVSLMGDDIIGMVDNVGNKTIKGRIFTYINKFFCKYFFDINISKSKNIAQALLKNTQTEIIPNGVNFQTFKPIAKDEARKLLNLNESKKIILFATDPERPEKNFQLAQEGVNLLQDDSIELLVVHNIDQIKLNLYYNAVDIVLLTSFHEGSPNVIKEALACNAVIISTDVGDVNENFMGILGVYITPFDNLALSNIITLAFENSSSNGREKIGHLNSEIIAKKILAIYKNC